MPSSYHVFAPLQEIKKLELISMATGMELSADGTVLTVTYGTHVTFYSALE